MVDQELVVTKLVNDTCLLEFVMPANTHLGLLLSTTGGENVAVATIVCLRQRLGEPSLPLPLLSNSVDNWGSHCSHCPSLPSTGEADIAVTAVVRLCRQLGKPLPPLSVTKNDWGSRCCHHLHRPTLLVTGGAIADVVHLC
jgi:hypothetical protein